jgi:hypothetical protein
MSTDKKRLSIGLSPEDYQWIDEKAELTGNSRAGVIRQIVRGFRLGKPGLLAFGDSELVFADEAGHTGDGDTGAGDEEDGDETEGVTSKRSAKSNDRY